MTLKEDMEADLRETFLNTDDFAEPRIIAGKQVNCVLYPANGDSAHDDPFPVGDCLYILQAAASDLPKIRVHDTLRINQNIWTVDALRQDFGMTVATLRRKA